MYEKLTTFRRLGDSLGLGENALKLLRRWGGNTLYHSLTSIGNQSQDMQIRRWHDGKVLAQQPLMDMAGYIGHRGDYHEAFLRGVRDAGIEIKVGHEVVGFGEGDDEDARPSVVFKDGTVVRADVIVGADGIKSRARELVLGFTDAPKSSGYSCWRAYFPGEHLKGDSLCQDFIDHDCVNIWCVILFHFRPADFLPLLVTLSNFLHLLKDRTRYAPRSKHIAWWGRIQLDNNTQTFA